MLFRKLGLPAWELSIVSAFVLIPILSSALFSNPIGEPTDGLFSRGRVVSIENGLATVEGRDWQLSLEIPEHLQGDVEVGKDCVVKYLRGVAVINHAQIEDKHNIDASL